MCFTENNKQFTFKNCFHHMNVVVKLLRGALIKKKIKQINLFNDEMNWIPKYYCINGDDDLMSEWDKYFNGNCME